MTVQIDKKLQQLSWQRDRLRAYREKDVDRVEAEPDFQSQSQVPYIDAVRNNGEDGHNTA